MRTMRNKSHCTQIAFAMTFLLVYSLPLAAQVDCNLVRKATEAAPWSRTFNIPTHIYSTTKFGDYKHEVEMIFVDGSAYFREDYGPWTLDNSIPKQAEERVARNPKSKYTCRYLGDEPVSGEMAAKYSAQDKARKSKTDELVWISKTSGLLLRQETKWDNGNVMILRLEYVNVKSPL